MMISMSEEMEGLVWLGAMEWELTSHGRVGG